MNDYIHVHRTKKLFVRSTRGHKLDPGPVPYFRGDGSNNSDPDQAQHCVSPDLGPNCLQRLGAYDKIHY